MSLVFHEDSKYATLEIERRAIWKYPGYLQSAQVTMHFTMHNAC